MLRVKTAEHQPHGEQKGKTSLFKILRCIQLLAEHEEWKRGEDNVTQQPANSFS